MVFQRTDINLSKFTTHLKRHELTGRLKHTRCFDLRESKIIENIQELWILFDDVR